MISLRSFRKPDLPRLYALDQACFAHDIAYSEAELKYFLGSARCSCWVAEEAGQAWAAFLIAGFLILERRRLRGNVTGHIVTIDVDPAMRRRGVGRLLFGAAEAEMRKEGTPALTLEVAEDNTVARAFYRCLGFADVGLIPKYYAGRLDAWVMEKSL